MTATYSLHALIYHHDHDEKRTSQNSRRLPKEFVDKMPGKSVLRALFGIALFD
jgi:hypothetical protein